MAATVGRDPFLCLDDGAGPKGANNCDYNDYNTKLKPCVDLIVDIFILIQVIFIF
jgi:hypothetical protein